MRSRCSPSCRRSGAEALPQAAEPRVGIGLADAARKSAAIALRDTRRTGRVSPVPEDCFSKIAFIGSVRDIDRVDVAARLEVVGLYDEGAACANLLRTDGRGSGALGNGGLDGEYDVLLVRVDRGDDAAVSGGDLLLRSPRSSCPRWCPLT